MMERISDDKKFNRELNDHIEDRNLVKFLFAMRSAQGLSQADIGKALSCSQSRVSKLESGTDDELRIGDLLAYANALAHRTLIGFIKTNSTLVDQVKHHAFRIKALLDEVATLVKEDKHLAEGIASFCGETLFNLIKLIQSCAEKLPTRTEEDKRNLQIQIHEGLSSDESDGAADGRSNAAAISRPATSRREKR